MRCLRLCVRLLRGIHYYTQKRHMRAQFKWTTNYETIVNKFLFRIVEEIKRALESPPILRVSISQLSKIQCFIYARTRSRLLDVFATLDPGSSS